jgi:hypothetical protein
MHLCRGSTTHTDPWQQQRSHDQNSIQNHKMRSSQTNICALSRYCYRICGFRGILAISRSDWRICGLGKDNDTFCLNDVSSEALNLLTKDDLDKMGTLLGNHLWLIQPHNPPRHKPATLNGSPQP